MKLHFFTHADNQPAKIEPQQEPVPVRVKSAHFFSEAEKQFVRDHWQTMTNEEIGQALGRTKSSIASLNTKFLGLIRNKAAKFRAASIGQKNRKDAYKDEEIQFLRDNWQTMSKSEMAKALGRTSGSIKSMGQKKMGLKKTHEALRQLQKRPNSGQFAKGNLPVNTVFGDEQVIRIRNNKKRGILTKYIRIGFAQWQEYQHYIWEQANGPVPKGMMLAFENGGRMDVRLDNLKLITKAENALRNSGSLNLSDGFIAHTLAWHDPELQQEMLQHPELIELKRNQLQLNRTIKSHDNAKPTKARRSLKRNDR